MFKGVFFILTILLVALIFYFAQKQFSGNLFLDIDTRYSPDETLDGTLSFSMKAGELVPANSIVHVVNGENTYDYVLLELVSDGTLNGDFYVEDKDISGSGTGYGSIGEKEVYPEVDFVLRITKTSEEASAEETEEATAEEGVEEEGVESEESEAEEVIGEETSPITGEVTAELTFDIQGSVSADNPYMHELGDGESAELVSSTQDVELDINADSIEITTDYSEVEQGFGEEYLGDEEYELVIDLSSLSIVPEQGELTVNLIYNDEEITSVSTRLLVDGEEADTEGEINKTEEVAEIAEEQNETEANETVINETEIIEVEQDLYGLSDAELFTLIAETGSDKVSVTKSEVVNDRLIVRYELGKYWRENSYAYNGNNMSSQVELDRKKFVKRVAEALSYEEYSSEQIDEYIGSYDLN